MASNPVPMSAQVLDALKAVSERYHTSHERRVGHELQVVIACLGLFAAVAAFRLSTSFAGQSNPAFIPVVLGSFLGLCLLATVYLKTSANSNALDLEKARAADQVYHRSIITPVSSRRGEISMTCSGARPHPLNQYQRFQRGMTVSLH